MGSIGTKEQVECMAIGKPFLRKIYLVTAVGPITYGRPLVMGEGAEARPHLFRDEDVSRRFKILVPDEPMRLPVERERL